MVSAGDQGLHEPPRVERLMVHLTNGDIVTITRNADFDWLCTFQGQDCRDYSDNQLEEVLDRIERVARGLPPI